MGDIDAKIACPCQECRPEISAMLEDMANGPADAGYWTASTVLQTPAETLSNVALAGLTSIHIIAFCLLCIGLYLSWRRFRSKAMTAYISGLAIGALGVIGILALRTGLDPAGEQTVAYAYTGDRFMTVAYNDSGLSTQDVIEARIIRIDGSSMPDGRMVILASFENGSSTTMVINQVDAVSLMTTLSMLKEAEEASGRNSA